MATKPESSELDPIGDAVTDLVRRLVDRGRRRLSRVASTGREQLELMQLRKDLDHFWSRLGKSAYRLVEAGELDHPALVRAKARIDELEARIEALERSS